MRRLAALCLGLLLTGAAPSTLWQYTLPPEFDVFGVAIASDAVVVSGQPGLLALDARTGHPLWRRVGAFTQPLIDGESVVIGSSDGAIRKRRLRDGAQVWESPYICADSKKLFYAYSKIVVGCDGGTVALVDRTNGALLRLSNEFQAGKIQNIKALGSCALQVSGVSSGAYMRFDDEIVDCGDLHKIWEGVDAAPLGAIGDIAIVDDMCCMGRSEEYRPATIYRVDLKSGRESAHIDLRPEEERYPPNSRPIGQGAGAFLSGNNLYVAVDQTLYFYGDPRADFRKPVVVTRDGANFRALSGGLWLYQKESKGPKRFVSIGTWSGVDFRAVWSMSDAVGYAAQYDANAPTYIVLPLSDPASSYLVRIRDHKKTWFPCDLKAAANSLAISVCTSSVLVNNRYLQVLTATPI